MVIVTILYLLCVYLVFHKFKLLPWNSISKGIVLLLGVIILSGFLVGLQGLTPASTQAVITGYVTEIAPQVSGRVVEVPVEPNVELEPETVLYRIDPLPYQYRVDQLKAQLADTEASVAQLKESYDAARAQTAATQAQLGLTRLRLGQQQELVAVGAGSRFELEQYESQLEQLEAQLEANRANEQAAYVALTSSVGDTQSRVAGVLAQLESAQYDLVNTEVTAPGRGVVTILALRPGMQASPSRSIATFVYTDRLFISGLFAQKALRAVKVGDRVKVSFPAIPGRLFEAEVVNIASGVGEGQYVASGQLARTSEQRSTRVFPVLISLPEDFPQTLRKVGLSADATIYTEKAGVVGIVATILQWIRTSLDLVI
jgi:multidrug resistance efflux pump